LAAFNRLCGFAHPTVEVSIEYMKFSVNLILHRAPVATPALSFLARLIIDRGKRLLMNLCSPKTLNGLYKRFAVK
jgi:hypothetical protein